MLSDFDPVPQIQYGDYTFKLDTGDISPEIEEIARKELRELPEIKKEAIIALKNLLKEETDLITPLENDQWLIKFLRPCKFYPESAFELIKRYYAFKVKHANIYEDLKPSKEQKIFLSDLITVLPNRDLLGRRYVLIELGKKWKHKEISLDDIYKGCVICMEAATFEPSTQVGGAVVIFDLDGFSLQQSWQFTPQFGKKLFELLQDAFPMRLKRIHIVNEPYIFNVVFAIFKPFLREKLRRRFIFHGSDHKSLLQYISPDCLLEAYGGSLDRRIPGPQCLELLLLFEKEFEAINSYGYKMKK